MAQPSTRLTMNTLLGLLLGLCLSSVTCYPDGSHNSSIVFDPDQMGDIDVMSDAYCKLLMDAPVPPTADQMPWYCICSHCKGTVGPKGDRGDRGLPGMPGSPGRRGVTGFRGRPGFIGRQGIKGEKGDEGLKGDKGPVGFIGNKGERGFKGDKGDVGVEGRAGDQGPKGDEGQCPDACDAARGPPGVAGLPGPAGPRGNPGVAGPSGPEGAKGDGGKPGVAGVPGSDGMKGDQGPEGDCNCTDGADGKPGPQGPAGPGGKDGAQGPQGTAGMPGMKGDEGDMGMPGIPGPCSPTIQSAFSAGLAYSYPSPNLPVVFANVFTNVQMHYNSTSGIYTAPVNGTYVFSYHLSVFGRVLKVGLFRNFLPVVKTTEPAELGTASQQVVLRLGMGDEVWIQVKDRITNGMYASIESSSTFSGYLLHPDSCNMPLFRDFNFGFEKDDKKKPRREYLWGESDPTTPPPTAAP